MSEKIFENHMKDLAKRSYEKNYAVYTEFLNLDEISILHSLSLEQKFLLFGGYENAERQVACFADDFDNVDFPIKCIKISPLNSKFSDSLTHRDFLGAVLNLGINRNTTGDIIVSKNTGFLFCLNSISSYIAENLTRVKHTSVKCEIIDGNEASDAKKPSSREINVPSQRADAVCAVVFKISRNKISALFKGGKVFINSRLCEKESANLSEGDVVSVRGYGKFVFSGEVRKTKKGRMVIDVAVYE